MNRPLGNRPAHSARATDGYLSQVSVNGAVKGNYFRDALGRVTDYVEYQPVTTAIAYKRYDIVYDDLNRVTFEKGYSDPVTAEQGRWSLTTNSYDVFGNIMASSVLNDNDATINMDDSDTPDSLTSYTYIWRDGA